MSTDPRYIGIVYLGMNPDAPHEGKLLQQANLDRGYARVITDSPVEGTLRVDGRDWPLQDRAGIDAYLASLGLPQDTLEACTTLLENCDPDARDELGQLIQVYWQAEQGSRRMERVVMSGHSNGITLWGDDNGYLYYRTFSQLARIFPVAASQVKDLMFSACYTGGEAQIQAYLQMFPALETLWAYAGSSPGVWSGALDHLRIWEKATELEAPAALSPTLAQGTRKGDHVAVWTRAGGYQGDEPITLEEARVAALRLEGAYQRYFQGEEEVDSPQSGPLREYYGAVQRVLQHPDLPEALRPEYEHRREVTLRLLYFANVRRKFAEAYAGSLQSGYQHLDRPVPNFAGMSRRNALNEVLAVAHQDAQNAPKLQALRDLLEAGLRDLEPRVIPITWA